jgi:hypothetical protein
MMTINKRISFSHAHAGLMFFEVKHEELSSHLLICSFVGRTLLLFNKLSRATQVENFPINISLSSFGVFWMVDKKGKRQQEILIGFSLKKMMR